MDHLFTVAGRSATPISPTELAAEGLLERQHLQEWVIANPQVLGKSVLVITAEFDRWADSDGVPARDRLDVLGLDATGRLVVVELKRGTADRDVHLQAITYAALVSRFDLDTLAQAHRGFLADRGQALDLDACRQRLLDHVDGEWSPELLQRPRQVIIAADFPKQVPHTVVWLSEMNLDIDLVQVGLWRVEGHLVAGFTKVYPTPEVEEFTLAPARAEAKAEAEARQHPGHNLVGRRPRPRPGQSRPRRVGGTGRDRPCGPRQAAPRCHTQHPEGLDEPARSPRSHTVRALDHVRRRGGRHREPRRPCRRPPRHV
ncbi:hypothetical protein AB0A77_33485 [Streptomyces varsoviensis]|uniref:hypothetical protein n=1 Tax=Streptomyces varsoviensis TaxID=67373 RepID=UPI0034083B10